VLVFPNAKINLGLNITAKRSDGYHDLESVFYPIPFCDALEVLEGGHLQKDEYFFSGLSIPGNLEDNLISKAIRLLRKDFQIPFLQVYLHKKIPMGGGLGGGSSDGSFALKALNEIFDLGLSEKSLCEYALKLGSDCPFFIENKPMRVSGRGEIMKQIELNLKGLVLVLLFPGKHIGTKEAYAHVAISESSRHPADIVIESEIGNWQNMLSNAFEPYAMSLHHEIAQAKETLIEKGAIYASMTGSGSTVYGLFEKEPELTSIDLPYWKCEL
jgi:4-diphosphocytidyl-2-C-methyl-D-erythritol kinase